MQAYLIEFLGTMFLTLVVALTGNPLAVGAVLVSLVYVGGPISGAHFNPAVTFAQFLRGNIKARQALRYVAIQLAGAFVAAAAYYLLKSMWFIPKPGDSVSFSAALLAEIIFSFLLAFTVLETTSNKAPKNNEYYGLAIGLVVMAGAFAVGPISGGVFNPAVGLGPLLFDIANWSSHLTWMLLYLLGPLAGGAIAGLVFNESKRG